MVRFKVGASASTSALLLSALSLSLQTRSEPSSSLAGPGPLDDVCLRPSLALGYPTCPVTRLPSSTIHDADHHTSLKHEEHSRTSPTLSNPDGPRTETTSTSTSTSSSASASTVESHPPPSTSPSATTHDFLSFEEWKAKNVVEQSKGAKRNRKQQQRAMQSQHGAATGATGGGAGGGGGVYDGDAADLGSLIQDGGGGGGGGGEEDGQLPERVYEVNPLEVGVYIGNEGRGGGGGGPRDPRSAKGPWSSQRFSDERGGDFQIEGSGTSDSPIQSDPNAGSGELDDPLTELSTRFNFASFDCAAMVHRASKSSKGSSSILSEKKDRYMLTPCSTREKFVTVELCDEIEIDTIVLANFEFFSSMFKLFRVKVSPNYPGKVEDWKDLGTFRARNVRGLQVFRVTNLRGFYRHIRIDFLTHFGSEYYCPVSLLRVYGLTQLDAYRRDQERERLLALAQQAAESDGDGDDDELEGDELTLPMIGLEEEVRMDDGTRDEVNGSNARSSGAMDAVGTKIVEIDIELTAASVSGTPPSNPTPAISQTIPTTTTKGDVIRTTAPTSSQSQTTGSKNPEEVLSDVLAGNKQDPVPIEVSSYGAAGTRAYVAGAYDYDNGAGGGGQPQAHTSFIPPSQVIESFASSSFSAADSGRISDQAVTTTTATTTTNQVPNARSSSSSAAEHANGTKVESGPSTLASVKQVQATMSQSSPGSAGVGVGSSSTSVLGTVRSSQLANTSRTILKAVPTAEPDRGSAGPGSGHGHGSTASSRNAAREREEIRTVIQIPSPPPTNGQGESIYGTIMKRLTMLEQNANLSMRYIDDQSRMLRDAFGKMEARLGEIDASRALHDQLLREILERMDRRESEIQAEREALASQMSILADEVLFGKRLGVAQVFALLAVILFVATTRGPTSTPLQVYAQSARRRINSTFSASVGKSRSSSLHVFPGSSTSRSPTKHATRTSPRAHRTENQRSPPTDRRRAVTPPPRLSQIVPSSSQGGFSRVDLPPSMAISDRDPTTRIDLLAHRRPRVSSSGRSSPLRRAAIQGLRIQTPDPGPDPEGSTSNRVKGVQRSASDPDVSTVDDKSHLMQDLPTDSASDDYETGTETETEVAGGEESWQTTHYRTDDSTDQSGSLPSPTPLSNVPRSVAEQSGSRPTTPYPSSPFSRPCELPSPAASVTSITEPSSFNSI